MMQLRIPVVLSCCLLVGLLLAPAQAAPKEKLGSHLPVAVVDLGRVFKEHARFKVQQAELKGDVARAEVRIKTEQEEIKKMAAGLKDLTIGSPERAELERSVKDRLEGLQTRVQLQKAEFVQREAEAYHDVYQEVVKEVADYADEHDLELVLRIESVPEETRTPQQILQNIKKQVVWYAKRRDITPAILRRINKGAGTAPEKVQDKNKDR